MSRTELKNPFYQIEVISFDGKRRAALTENIQRLVNSVQIQEHATTGEHSGTNQLQIDFVQTDYLPEDGGLRPQDPKVFGEITNRPNAIIDLRFDSEKGFTFVSQEEMESGITESRRSQSGKSDDVVFLFQPENFIEITWGYLEPYEARTRKFKIVSIDANGSASGDGQISIIATDVGYELNKTTPTTGIIFQTSKFLPPELPLRGGTEDQPLSLKQTLFRIAKGFGARLEYDGEFVDREPEGTDQYDELKVYGSDSAPVEKAFRVPKGLDYRTFVNNLASEFESRVEYDTDEDGNDIIRFTKTETLYKDSIDEFTYKDGNGVLKAYKLVALDAWNVKKTTVSNNLREVDLYIPVKLTEGTRKFTSGLDIEDEKQIEEGLGTSGTGYSETHPSDEERSVDSHAERMAYARAYQTQLTITTIGHPRYRPRMFEMNNIGARYSGSYRAYTVTHKINTSGYDCEWTAQRFDIQEGGSTSQEVAAQNQFIDTQLTEPRE